MATISFSIPKEVKNRFNQVFQHENKSQIITELMKQAIENHERQILNSPKLFIIGAPNDIK